mmetsp:Transcript_90936/g.266272  ORF Transcript_90936/g.266272 Transcript_90936/m.266272 type:complete len:310 (-) Transcript_90936:706-1635(-)
MSLSWPTAKVKAARTTAAGTLRFFFSSRSNQPRSPARSPPRSAVSHSESARQRAVKAAGPPSASSQSNLSNCTSASPDVRVAFGLRSPAVTWHPECRNRMCRQRTFCSTSVRARLGADASPDSDRGAHATRTAAATSGASAPSARTASNTATQAARGRSATTCVRARLRKRSGEKPARRTQPTVSTTPKWLSPSTAQCVAGLAPAPTSLRTSRLSMLPSATPSPPKSTQSAPPEATSVRRPPSSSATARPRPPSSAPSSRARSSTDSSSAPSRRSLGQRPRCCARRGRSRTWRPFAAASATAPPPTWPS